MDKQSNLDNLRHSCSHLLAAAVLELYPDAKPTIGPPIDDGFYYDFDFKTPISENDLILMGGKTYETAKKNIKPKAGKLRIVITHDPERFSGDQKENQLEFTNRPIPELIQTLESRGFKQMLLLSGEGLNKQFFEAGLINEIILTVEPVIFGRGRGIIAEANLDLKLKLLSFEKLNNKGTMLLHYQVL